MSDFGPAVTDDQWSRIRQIVHDEALRARAVESFPPVYRPLLGVWSRPLMGHPYRVIRRMRCGPSSAWERHDDCGDPSSDTA